MKRKKKKEETIHQFLFVELWLVSIIISLAPLLLIVNDSPPVITSLLIAPLMFPSIVIITSIDLRIPVINVAYVSVSIVFLKNRIFEKREKKTKECYYVSPHSICIVSLLSSTCQIIAIKFSVLSFPDLFVLFI